MKMPIIEILSTLAATGFRIVLFVYDVITLPVYLVIYRPWYKLAKWRANRVIVTEKGEDYVAFEAKKHLRVSETRQIIINLNPPADTLPKLFQFAVERNTGRPCLGTREIFGEEFEIQSDGKEFCKLIQGDYKWKPFDVVYEEILAIARGLIDYTGLFKGERVVIFADTKEEWLISALACFEMGLTIVTLYTNLGDEAIVHGITQTKVNTVIVDQDHLPALERNLNRLSNVKNIIVITKKYSSKSSQFIINQEDNRQVLSYNKVLETGRNSQTSLLPPDPDDLAVLMFTSGSTGVPKAVKLTHKQLSSAITSMIDPSCDLAGERECIGEAFIAYLPLAHIFELTMEIALLILGMKVGYSSPNTLSDTSTMIKNGQRGDAFMLKPIAMIAVPLILDRMYKGIQAKIRTRGIFFYSFFQVLMKYRLFWIKWGLDTPILNKLLFSKLREGLGGKIRTVVGGGAPLYKDVHEYIRTCLCVTVLQGYGLTETAGGCVLGDSDDLGSGHVGYPLPDVKLKLTTCEEGGYTVKDINGPRGEILIGCPWLADGYLDLEEETRANFFNENGTRWFKTGDIGYLTTNGNIEIIDRKKDIVKLQMGEYISLGKVETTLKAHFLVENACVYADPSKNSCVAIVVPDPSKLKSLSETEFNIHSEIFDDIENLCSDPDVRLHVKKQIQDHAKESLEKFEMPANLILVPGPWLPSTGLVTAAMKLRRKAIENKYRNEIAKMYIEMEAK